MPTKKPAKTRFVMIIDYTAESFRASVDEFNRLQALSESMTKDVVPGMNVVHMDCTMLDRRSDRLPDLDRSKFLYKALGADDADEE